MECQLKLTPTFADQKANGGLTVDHEPTTQALLNGPQFVPKLIGESAPIPEVKNEPDKILKIAIIGTAPSSRMMAPYNDPSWTIWVCSPGNMNIIPRCDAWFEIHANLLWPECASYGSPYVEWLKKQTFPVYMQDQALVPNALTFPKEELVKEFGRYFFTSSFAWMMAFAIKQGAKEIALFGVDMASKDEYILQRPGGHFFMQVAVSRGIKVSLPTESDLAQPPALYGYAEKTPFLRKMHVRTKELQDRVGAMKIERDKLSMSIAYLEGALEDLDYVKSIWGGAQEG